MSNWVDFEDDDQVLDNGFETKWTFIDDDDDDPNVLSGDCVDSVVDDINNGVYSSQDGTAPPRPQRVVSQPSRTRQKPIAPPARRNAVSVKESGQKRWIWFMIIGAVILFASFALIAYKSFYIGHKEVKEEPATNTYTPQHYDYPSSSHFITHGREAETSEGGTAENEVRQTSRSQKVGNGMHDYYDEYDEEEREYEEDREDYIEDFHPDDEDFPYEE